VPVTFVSELPGINTSVTLMPIVDASSDVKAIHALAQNTFLAGIYIIASAPKSRCHQKSKSIENGQRNGINYYNERITDA
jgi:hypothetical protein